jgi:hypothetical protein
MKVKREISSIPQRTAEKTWEVICDLITGKDSEDIAQLDRAASVLHSLIADELFCENPLTITGVSHRLIIYLRYRADALEEGDGVDSLEWNPTAGDWTMYVPCDDENFEWVKNSLASRAPRLVAHRTGETPWDDDKKATASEERLEINWGVLNG